MMASKEEITRSIRARFSHMRDQARVLGLALKARADIAVSHRRLRSAYADLGEDVYGRMVAEPEGPWAAVEALQEYRVRIDGVRTEVKQRERVLAEILAGGGQVEVEVEAGGDAETPVTPGAVDADAAPTQV